MKFEKIRKGFAGIYSILDPQDYQSNVVIATLCDGCKYSDYTIVITMAPVDFILKQVENTMRRSLYVIAVSLSKFSFSEDNYSA